MKRYDNRRIDEMRPLEFILDVAPNSTASVLACFGQTRVICSVTIEEDVPRWMKAQRVLGGWLTAEYSMLPYSTLTRKRRDSTAGKVDGRSTEIQRLIGRALRAAVDLDALGSRTIWIDCDVLQADGGTRTASITGAAVALAIALNRLVAKGLLVKSPLKKLIAAVSVGKVDSQPMLDLCYVEDRDAEVDMNVVMTESGEFVELQGSGEESVFTPAEMAEMISLAQNGMKDIIAAQRKAIESADSLGSDDLAGLKSFFAR